MASRLTPLSVALNEDGREARPTPLTAFREARRWWLKGRRLNLSALAEELGVGRATLMRWVGNKELLIGEIIWSLYKQLFDEAVARADQRPELTGVDYLATIYYDLNVEIMQAQPLRRFLQDDPRFGLQVLTSNVNPLQQRLVDTWRDLLDQQVAAGHIAPAMKTDDLAYFIIRIGEGTVYSDFICDREPDPVPANTAFRLLLTGRV
jgi:AcrR family transcriptional regulator